MPENGKPVRAPDLRRWKAKGRRVTVLTAYDAVTARRLERAGVDVLLVGDSLGMVVLGHETTVPVTIEDIVHHTRAVSRVVRRPLVVADMPFLSYRTGLNEAVRNAGILVQQGGAAAVKLEGGGSALRAVAQIIDAGIPVMGHLGLTPQSVHQLGGFGRQAKDSESADALLDDARGLEAAGAFAMVLESIPAELATRVSAEVSIPTIGIGAGPDCDGQVLVTEDMLGLVEEPPPFARVYAQLGDDMEKAVRAFADDVREGRFGRKD